MSDTVKILFAGDIYIKENSNLLVSEELQKLIMTHDIRSCNFEAPVVKGNESQIAKAGSYLSSKPEDASLVVKAGFNLISLANNHIYDYGDAGIKNTLDYFSGAMVTGAGMDFSEAYSLRKIQVKGITIGFLSFCESEFGALTEVKSFRGGYAWINHPCVNSLIINSKNEVDFLAVQIHAGIEEINLPLPEWRDRYKEILDLGADVIIGHHPHVPQGWEQYNNKYIFYSLGNFYFDMFSEEKYWNKGYIVSLNVKSDRSYSFEVIPVQKNKKTDLSKDLSYSAYLKELCSLLNEPGYSEGIKKICVSLWQSRYRKYYVSAMNGLSGNDSVFRIFRLIIRRIVHRRFEKKNLLLLLHNIRIESHRWLVQRALSILAE